MEFPAVPHLSQGEFEGTVIVHPIDRLLYPPIGSTTISWKAEKIDRRYDRISKDVQTILIGNTLDTVVRIGHGEVVPLSVGGAVATPR